MSVLKDFQQNRIFCNISLFTKVSNPKLKWCVTWKTAQGLSTTFQVLRLTSKQSTQKSMISFTVQTVWRVSSLRRKRSKSMRNLFRKPLNLLQALERNQIPNLSLSLWLQFDRFSQCFRVQWLSNQAHRKWYTNSWVLWRQTSLLLERFKVAVTNPLQQMMICIYRLDLQ